MPFFFWSCVKQAIHFLYIFPLVQSLTHSSLSHNSLKPTPHESISFSTKQGLNDFIVVMLLLQLTTQFIILWSHHSCVVLAWSDFFYCAMCSLITSPIAFFLFFFIDFYRVHLILTDLDLCWCVVFCFVILLC